MILFQIHGERGNRDLRKWVFKIFNNRIFDPFVYDDFLEIRRISGNKRIETLFHLDYISRGKIDDGIIYFLFSTS
jgi:hypothetical protein